MVETYTFGPIDIDQLRLLASLTPGERIRLMLSARELAVGLMRGRLRRLYPDLSWIELNLKLLEELDHAKERQPRSKFIPRHSENT